MSILSTFKKYKDYILTDSGYQLSSRWTKSDAVVMGDGTDDTNTLEANLGAIKGITTDLACEDENVAASMSAVGAAITELNNGLKHYVEQINDGCTLHRYGKLRILFLNIATSELKLQQSDLPSYQIRNTCRLNGEVGWIMVNQNGVSYLTLAGGAVSTINCVGEISWIVD